MYDNIYSNAKLDNSPILFVDKSNILRLEFEDSDLIIFAQLISSILFKAKLMEFKFVFSLIIKLKAKPPSSPILLFDRSKYKSVLVLNKKEHKLTHLYI